MPSGMGLLVFTFLLLLKPLQEYAETLVAKNISAPIIGWLMVLLVPQALALTIPMSLLVGLLVGFGRLSADREFVAMQACGIGLKRLLYPVGVVSLLSLAATAYIWFWGYPNANAAFLDNMVQVLAERAEGNVRPHVFYREIPNLMLYVRDVPPSGDGWDGVFMADMRGQPEAVYMARHGRIAVNRTRRTVDIVLDDTIRRTVDQSGQYDIESFQQLILSIDQLGCHMLGLIFQLKHPRQQARLAVQTLLCDRSGSDCDAQLAQRLPANSDRRDKHCIAVYGLRIAVYGLRGPAGQQAAMLPDAEHLGTLGEPARGQIRQCGIVRCE